MPNPERTAPKKKHNLFKSLMITINKASLPSFVMLLLIFVVYSAIDTKNSKRIVDTSATLEQSLKENAESKKKGSDLGMAHQFSSARDGLVELYKRFSNPNSSDDEKKYLERLAILFKLPILKRTIATDFERRNYSFEIINLREEVKYTNKNFFSQKVISIKAKYDALMDIRKDHSFYIYVVPGLSLKNINDIFSGNCRINLNGIKREISFKDCEKRILGSREAPSPLIECKIEIDNIADGDIVQIDYSLRPVDQAGDTIVGNIPFSLYDVQVGRFPKGIRELNVVLQFEGQEWIEGIAFNMDDFSHHPLNKSEINFVYPKNYLWNSSSDKYEFIIRNPREPFAIAFYKYQNYIMK